MAENRILRRLFPAAIEDTGGLYIAVKGDDEAYISLFPELCRRASPCEFLPVKEALELEPALSKDAIAAFRVEDASVEPFHVSLENMNQAIEHGAGYFNFCKVVKFHMAAKAIQKVVAKNLVTRQIFEIEARMVVNAAGAWAG